MTTTDRDENLKQDHLAGAREITKKMGISEKELERCLTNGKGDSASQEEQHVNDLSAASRLSMYEKSIIVGTLMGLGYIADMILRCGLKRAAGMMGYVAFCLFMISSKRLLENRVGTYFIGTGIRLSPARRPQWGASIALGWVFLSLPALLKVLKMIGKQ